MEKVKINLLMDLLKETNIDDYISFDELSEINGLELVDDYEPLTKVYTTQQGRKVVIYAFSGLVSLMFDNVKNKENHINVVVNPSSEYIGLYDRIDNKNYESYLGLTNRKYRRNIIGEAFNFKNLIKDSDIKLSTTDVKDKLCFKSFKVEKQENNEIEC